MIPFDDEEEALAAANDTEYGLAGAIWTENLGRAHRVANELRAGQVWVNCALGADPVDADLRPQAVGLGRRARPEGH